MTELNPANFDIEGWIRGTSLPRTSATVYGRADLIARMKDIKAQLDIEQRAAKVDPEATEGGPSPEDPLWTEYERLLHEFAESRLTIHLTALLPERIQEISNETEAFLGSERQTEYAEEFGYRILAASIVAVKSGSGPLVDTAWTADQVRAVDKAVGPAQFGRILDAQRMVASKSPSPDADFLL